MRKGQKIVTVFCCSSQITPRKFWQSSWEIGKLLAENGWTIKNGGGSGNSLMGAVTDGAKLVGGKVYGVILKEFLNIKHTKLNGCEVCNTISKRKEKLVKGTNAIIVLPGGFGTLNEFIEVLSHKQRGLIDVPIIVLNQDNFYSPLINWFKNTLLVNNCLTKDDLELFTLASSPEEVIKYLSETEQKL